MSKNCGRISGRIVNFLVYKPKKSSPNFASTIKRI